MAGLLTASMTADAPAADDIPSKPVYTAFDDNEATEEEIKPKKSAPQPAPARTPIVPRPALITTYKPAYVPPSPADVPTSAKPKAVVDTSKVHAGVIVKHKAFGTGKVKGIDGGMIVVVFNSIDKKFQFPGAFEQGFLAIEE